MTPSDTPSDTAHSDSAKFTNRLIDEKSPYLLQHAHNPVDWYPWGEPAFAKAQAEDKMVLVSIGYATCHWCHVMERESFEDEALAQYLNRHFVAVKVDREERPDVDKIYMDSLHALGQQGGWPLNMFLTPDRRPVTGGTYFPPHDMHGRLSFRGVLEAVQKAWHNDRESILRNAELLTGHLNQRSAMSASDGTILELKLADAAVAAYRKSYDNVHGGFANSGTNKFPPSMGLMLLLRHHARSGDHHSLEMVRHTLRKMRGGGIYDQIGGGLSRYSTDHQWLVPHFEKMLYDNALFAQALIEAHQVAGGSFFRTAAEDVLAYLMRDMQSPEGAFYSAEDADSEGAEGKFYLWRPQEVQALLEPEDARRVMAYWDIKAGGNFEDGASIPNAPESPADVATRLGIAEEELAASLERARPILLTARAQRVRPLRDDKVLTSWNALAVSALARAARVFGGERYRSEAERAARFILNKLRDGKGRLLRRWREGEARFPAYLVDHAQLANACLDLYELTFDPPWFEEALALMRAVNELFRNEGGPYFDTGSDAESLIARTIDGYDGVEPSGNSSAALAFLRLHAYGVREGFDADALRIFSGFYHHLEQTGTGFPAMLTALEFHLAPPLEIAIVGDRTHPETRAMLEVLHRRYLPAAVVAFATPQEVASLGGAIPLLQDREAVGGKPTAYICHDMTCQLPVHTSGDLIGQISQN